MKLVTLRLENYRSHESTLIDFRQFNIAVFLGDNGSGKSSVAGALKWVVFGDEDPEDVLMIGQDAGFVRLVFDEADCLYMVKRSLIRNGDKVKSKFVFKVKVNNTWEDRTDRGIGSKISTQNKVLDVIRADNEIFSHTSFIEEGEIDSLMKLKPQDRRDVFSRPEGLLIYECAFKSVKKLLSESNAMYRLVSEKVLDFKVSYKDKFDMDLNSIDKLNGKLFEAKKQLVRIKEKLKDIERTKQNLSESDSAKQQIEILQKAINQAKERYLGLEDDNDELLKEGKDAEDKIPELNKKIEKKDKDQIISEKTQVSSDLNDANDSIETIRESISDLKVQLKKIKMVCDECGNELDENQFDQAKKRLKRKIELKETELETKFEEKQQLSQDLEAVEERYRKVKDLIKERNELQEVVEKYTNVYLKHEESKMNFEKVKDTNTEKIVELRKKVISGKDVDEYEDTKDDYDETSKLVAILDEKISNVMKIENKKKDEVMKFKELVKQKIEVRKERQALTLAKQGFIEIPELIINEAVPELEEHSNDILGQFSKDLSLKILTEDDNGNSTFDWMVTNSGRRMKYSQLSQGEQMRVCFSFRIGNGIRCSYTRGCKLDFLVIDEIHALDEAGLNEFSDIIKGLSKVFKNIIIISHLKDITQYFSTQFVFANKNGKTKMKFLKNGDEVQM